MKWLICLICVWTIYLEPTYAQDTLQLRRNVSIYGNTTTMLGMNPRIRIGMNLAGEKWGYSLAVGYGSDLRTSFFNNPIRYGYAAYELRTELKHYDRRRSDRKSHVYYSAEAFFLSVEEEYFNSFYYLKDNTALNFGKADFEKMNAGVHAKVGLEYYLFNHILCDVYIGLGAAYVKVDFDNVQGAVPFEERQGRDATEAFRYEGGKVLPSLAFGLNLGWVFWRD